MKKTTAIFSLVFVLATTLVVHAQDSTQINVQYPFGEPGSTSRGVFGPDDRKEAQDAIGYQDFVRATAVMVSKESIRNNVAYSYSLRERLSMTFNTDNFDDNVMFLEQPALANCTGFLIAPDILVTAGHCIKTIEDAEPYVWVFDYTSTQQFNTNTHAIPLDPDDVYEVAEVLSAALDDETSDDYAVLRLKRKSDRRPYRFRTSGTITEGTGVNTIGAPTGLPLKFAENAEVVDASPTNWFKSDIDSFPGNSGGPVFDDYGWIEGILVRGAVTYRNGDYTGDYYYDETCDCIKTVNFNSASYTAGCQSHKITHVPSELLVRSIYENLAYAITKGLQDRFDDWAVYQWIFTHQYAKENGLLEVLALKEQNYGMYAQMLDYAFPTYTDSQRRELLDYTISTNNNTLYTLLLEQGIYADAGANKTYTALQEAVKEANTGWVVKLVDAGADAQVKDDGDNNLLHLAAATGNTTLINYLYGLEPQLIDSENRAGDLPERVAKDKGYKKVFKYMKKMRKSR
ncbi:trypsin-like peptidase domain-containing protein [Leeuwenhoekiella sp. CH_XMU1409-2]|uniref:trypsin-like peptidase domain-containing protein n=1 Tax=Leeuwenhoekiella sp. CH_XMU1409-2 TaxID=3107768 RepID=UPI003008A453|tara:strand:+ start:870 stop:2414 length:1545 start_codon:yes stop_codon:yes gene_type:complete